MGTTLVSYRAVTASEGVAHATEGGLAGAVGQNTEVGSQGCTVPEAPGGLCPCSKGGGRSTPYRTIPSSVPAKGTAGFQGALEPLFMVTLSSLNWSPWPHADPRWVAGFLYDPPYHCDLS